MMYDCPECKNKSHKYSELGSRINSLKYHEEMYDNIKGKGSFKRDHPDSKKLMNDLLDKKTRLLMEHMSHSTDAPEDKGSEKSVGVPVY